MIINEKKNININDVSQFLNLNSAVKVEAEGWIEMISPEKRSFYELRL